MSELLALLALGLLILLLAGAGCGIAALVRQSILDRRLRQVEERLRYLQAPRTTAQPTPQSTQSVEPKHRGEFAEEPSPDAAAQKPFAPSRPHVVEKETAITQPAPSKPPEPSIPPPLPKTQSEVEGLEMLVGTKWLNWVGIVLVIASVAFFMKYAYDNAWIGPKGRLLIGVIAGFAALVAGEKMRRAAYAILFRVLTGGGIAVFYICTYFSFQVYQFISPSAAFMISLCITLLGVGLGVFHDAKAICILGQIGGFLSPLLFSTGTGQAVQLFSYIFALNCIMVWSAYFRNWPEVNITGLFGTAILYGLWLFQTYTPNELGVALFFSSVFYLTFLNTPLLRPAVERKAADVNALKIIIIATVLAFLNYCVLLLDDYPSALAGVVVLQAVVLVGLCQIWVQRCPEDTRTVFVLQLVALCLVTVALPIRLRFYALVIAWSIEAVLLAYAGARYASRSTLAFGHGALTLAAAWLLLQLPIHNEPFMPVLNTAFGSWALCIAAAAIVYRFQPPAKSEKAFYFPYQSMLPAAFGVLLSCVLLHFEVTRYWLYQEDAYGKGASRLLANTGAMVLWSLIAFVSAEIARKRSYPKWMGFTVIPYAIGLVLVFIPMVSLWRFESLPYLNPYFLSRALFVAALLHGAWFWRPSGFTDCDKTAACLEVLAHFTAVVYIPVETSRGLETMPGLSSMHQHGVVSGLWSLYALVLIVAGLRTRMRLRRILGILLFGITVMKILLLDMSQLKPVYRIVSLFASGALLIAAGYVYQKYAKKLLMRNDETQV